VKTFNIKCQAITLSWISEVCCGTQISCSNQDTFVSGVRLLVEKKKQKALAVKRVCQEMRTGFLICFKGARTGCAGCVQAHPNA
jgi:hypothetical protein